MEERHNSLGELAQPPLFSLRMRGDSSMSHSICMSRKYGKGIHCCLQYYFYNVYMHPLTIHVQDDAPRRSILFSRPHGLVEAISMIDGHPLGGLGEEIYYGGHTHGTPCIIHFLHTYEEIGAAGKWLRSHTFYQSLLQLRVKLCWLHLRDHFPSHLLHMAASMILIFAPYGSNFSVFMRSMLEREANYVDVSFEGEIPHTICTTCSKGSMGYGMVTLTTQLLLYEVNHTMDVMPYDDDFQLIIYGDMWANMICSVGGEIFGYLVLILPLEGKLIAA